jgi:hypothetical protein
VRQSVDLLNGAVDIWQPREAAELPDNRSVEWAPMAPYWAAPDEIVERGHFGLVLLADVHYERQSVAALLSLLPMLAGEAWVADPGRPAASAFIEQAKRRWQVEVEEGGVVSLYRLRLAGARP